MKLAYQENNGVELNLTHPRTFNEKLLYLSLHDRTPLKTMCADKYRVRDYVCSCGLSSILNELYGVFPSTDAIDLRQMPQCFFMRANHDSGTYALIDQSHSKATVQAFRKIDQALSRNYYQESREWQYKDIAPLVLCEKVLSTDDPLGLCDYRFFCFEGKVGFLCVDIGTTRASGKHSYTAKRNLYNRDFTLLDARLKRDPFDSSLLHCPTCYQEMLDIAETLSKPFHHVRVDLYCVNNRIVFGEMTFCHSGGMQMLEPMSLNMEMGDLIRLEDL